MLEKLNSAGIEAIAQNNDSRGIAILPLEQQNKS